jgi:phosphate transport system permease protein
MGDTVSFRPHGDAAPRLDRLLNAAALTSGLIFVAIVVMLVVQSAPVVFGHGATLLAPSTPWEPQEAQLGMAAMVGASLLVALLALMLAIPLALLAAAWLQLFAPPGVARLVRALLELMAGIPSVVYGLWGVLVLIPMINRVAPPGASWLASSVVLAAMIVPLVLLVADAAFARFPREQRAAADALGISRWGLWRGLMLPHAGAAIVSGVVLQFGRALGETMAVLMVAGNVVQWPDSLLSPVRTLTANIALEMAYATGEHRAALYVSGLLLTVLTTLLLLGARRWREAIT